ncbi:MAG: hypothetical protein D3905_07365 [Candidatus Electrothrix sp. AS4_5]|nr:hypothetical protein [Candidatus Electrothrix gigas]
MNELTIEFFQSLRLRIEGGGPFYTAAVLEGRKEGLLEGKLEGIKEGKEQGKQEGIKEGEKKKAMQIARKLLAAGGLDIQSIAAMTDLSVEEINLLKNKEENI